MSSSREVRVGDRLRFYRQSRGKTQAVVAGLAGITEDYLWQIERGLKTPALPVTRKLAEILGVQLSELLGEAASVPSAGGIRLLTPCRPR